jgi:hypothetical protein
MVCLVRRVSGVLLHYAVDLHSPPQVTREAQRPHPIRCLLRAPPVLLRWQRRVAHREQCRCSLAQSRGRHRVAARQPAVYGGPGAHSPGGTRRLKSAAEYSGYCAAAASSLVGACLDELRHARRCDGAVRVVLAYLALSCVGACGLHAARCQPAAAAACGIRMTHARSSAVRSAAC